MVLIDTKVYADNAKRTLSDKFYGHMVDSKRLKHALEVFADNAAELDTAKKALFYGRDPQNFGNMINAPVITDKVNVLHAVIGIATEAGEMVENWLNGATDNVNIKEELGDLLWYMAILASEVDITLADCMATNIAKLQKRFPEKFTEKAANERDLAAERVTLEGSNGVHFTAHNEVK